MKAMTLKRARLGSRAVVKPQRFWRGGRGPGGCWPGLRSEGKGGGRRERESGRERGVRERDRSTMTWQIGP